MKTELTEILKKISNQVELIDKNGESAGEASFLHGTGVILCAYDGQKLVNGFKALIDDLQQEKDYNEGLMIANNRFAERIAELETDPSEKQNPLVKQFADQIGSVFGNKAKKVTQ